ncbi:putative Mrr restriction system protein [Actinacidiphila reveromycinica]|uniref:Putative Mrr restriction system protein n=1 Tax=Actinacidiphila reveromycinica TaxID=659352 RepID=A0A7U3UNP9_9ACTN|nr:restriction endonuclease [Streptomyces sp. SN-593]BBA95921.1 putative Mrr restriction system protein [Streptomyces sp. SN-593]
MSRRSTGSVSTWAEIQRQQQRQTEAQHRAQEQQRRDAERRQRAAERALARSQKEQQAAYRRRREDDARRRTEELEHRVEELAGLLRAGCAAPLFSPEALVLPEELEPFAPGPLAVPVAMPRLEHYAPAHRSTWSLGRQDRQVRERYERDLAVARAAEAQRQRQLADYQERYRRWAEQRLAEVRRHNAGVRDALDRLRDGEPDAVEEYLTGALYSSRAWPEGLPRQVSATFEAPERQLVLDWELPALAVVPEAALVRYMPSVDRDKEVARPVTERRAVYRDLLAQCLLLVLREVFGADRFDLLGSVVLNGFVDDTDPATGHRSPVFLATARVARADFAAVNLAQVNAVDCLVDGLGGQLSARPDRRAEVVPVRRPGEAGRRVVSHGGGEEPDLLTMDPLEFEELVAELFRAMGMSAVTTVRSGDGGVDVDALDPDPIRGGKIVVQVKRYRNTVTPSAVRDLYGTVQSMGANKGVLITTSGFGPTSHAFANGKPLTLVSGTDLVELLHQHGLGGRLGGGPPSAGAAGTPTGGSNTGVDDEPDASVLGMWWAGDVALDVCALVCAGGRVLGDDHFVFYNNPRTPDGSVRMMPGLGGDKAAIWVSFDRLPAGADRVVLVAAIDPEVNPDADLAGFTDARIRLTDPEGSEADRLDVSDGRPGETALVLGSFRRRSGDDWAFVPGGKGYQGSGGLVELVQEHGIEVE